MTSTRRVLIACSCVVLALAPSGCGTKFKLPTENREGRLASGDGSYIVGDTWTAADGMAGIVDIVVTPGGGSQLFLLFNDNPSAPTQGLAVLKAYKFKSPSPVSGISFIPDSTQIYPVALCSGGNRVFMLTQGDTCKARRNPFKPVNACPPLPACCGDTTGGWQMGVFDLSKSWRVHDYGLLGGRPSTTFTDTNMYYVRGIAADDRDNVYVSGLALVYVPDQVYSNVLTRTVGYRVFKYHRGSPEKGPTVPSTGASAWSRDTSYVVEEGSGVGSMVDPRGMQWSASALYAADAGNNAVQKLSDQFKNTGFFRLEAAPPAPSDTALKAPADVCVDELGYIYVADTGNKRVLRFGPGSNYIQRVNVNITAGQALIEPTIVAADTSLVYVGDPKTSRVIRFERLP